MTVLRTEIEMEKNSLLIAQYSVLGGEKR